MHALLSEQVRLEQNACSIDRSQDKPLRGCWSSLKVSMLKASASCCHQMKEEDKAEPAVLTHTELKVQHRCKVHSRQLCFSAAMMQATASCCCAVWEEGKAELTMLTDRAQGAALL